MIFGRARPAKELAELVGMGATPGGRRHADMHSKLRIAEPPEDGTAHVLMTLRVSRVKPDTAQMRGQDTNRGCLIAAT